MGVGVEVDVVVVYVENVVGMVVVKIVDVE